MGATYVKKKFILLESIYMFKSGYTQSFPYSVKHAHKAD